MFANDLVAAGKIFELNSGDNIVFTSGLIDGNTGNTNMIKVERI